MRLHARTHTHTTAVVLRGRKGHTGWKIGGQGMGDKQQFAASVREHKRNSGEGNWGIVSSTSVAAREAKQSLSLEWAYGVGHLKLCRLGAASDAAVKLDTCTCTRLGLPSAEHQDAMVPPGEVGKKVCKGGAGGRLSPQSSNVRALI